MTAVDRLFWVARKLLSELSVCVWKAKAWVQAVELFSAPSDETHAEITPSLRSSLLAARLHQQTHKQANQRWEYFLPGKPRLNS